MCLRAAAPGIFRLAGRGAFAATLLCVILVAGLGQAQGLQDYGSAGQIEVQSEQYLLDVGGHWIIDVVAAGGHDLEISAVNGTDFEEDLWFVGLHDHRAGGFAPVRVLDDALVFEGLGGEPWAGYLEVRVQTPGSHHLMFKFGDDTAYVDGHAAFPNVTSTDGDGVYGYLDTVRIGVDFSGPVTVDLGGISHGAADMEGNVFDAVAGATSVATATVNGSVYVLVAGRSASGVQIIDVTNPDNPLAAASVRDDYYDSASAFETLLVPKDIATVAVDGRTYAIVTSFADDGIQVIDVTDPRHPAAVSSARDDRPGAPSDFDTLSASEGITTAVISGRTYAIVTSFADDGIQVIDVTDPRHPAAVSSARDDRPAPLPTLTRSPFPGESRPRS